MKKFKQSDVGRKPENKKDAKGSIRVHVVLCSKGIPVKGNISRQFTIADARVSEVFKAIKESILED